MLLTTGTHSNMFNQPTNAFQQAQMQTLQQIPTDRLIHEKVNRLPNLVGVQFSPNMTPYAQKVVTEAINQIQDTALNSEPRAFFFNIIATNGFDNPQFREFVTTLSQFIELVVLTQNQHPDATIPQATTAYITYSVANMAMNNGSLLNRLQPVMVQAMQQNVHEFQSSVQQMRQFQQRPALGMGVNVQSSMGLGGRQLMSTPSAGVQFNNSALFSGGVNPIFTGTASGGGMNIESATAERHRGNPQAASTPTQATTTVKIEPVNTSRGGQVIEAGSIVDHAAQQTTAAMPSTVVKYVGDPDSVTWVPSSRWPCLPTYDPNKEELKFHVYSDGSIQPVIAQLTIMDRDQHLKPLAITPKWTAVSQQQVNTSPATADQKDANQVISPDEIRQLLYPGNPSTSITHKENWVYAEACMLSLRGKQPDKVTLALKYSILTDTLICSAKVIALIKNLLQSTTATQATTYIKNAVKIATQEQNNLDMRAINRLVTRLTQRVNRFVTVDMSLNFGRIDNYVDDAADLAPFLNKKVGQVSADMYEQAHKRIVKEAVTIAEGDLHQAIQRGEFSDCQLPEQEGLTMAHLYNNVCYGVLDATTIELQSQIPKERYSVLISKSSTPLMHSLAERLTNAKSMQEKGGSGFECDRFLLRTSDGVTLEISRAAFVAGEFVVALYSNE